MISAPDILIQSDGTSIAYQHIPGRSPGVMFCSGFMSDMNGTKALALEDHCRTIGRAYTRFDYRGHGLSSGDVVDGTIGLWAEDALSILDQVTTGPQIVVGSSMGAWIMLLLARYRPERLAGLVGIAPAPDFVLRLWDNFSEEIRQILYRDGVYQEPSIYSDIPYPITLKLIEDGRANLVLEQPSALPCPVRLIHGLDDPDVPWEESLRLMEKLGSSDLMLTLIKNGDHRLSRPTDIERIIGDVEALDVKGATK